MSPHSKTATQPVPCDKQGYVTTSVTKPLENFKVMYHTKTCQAPRVYAALNTNVKKLAASSMQHEAKIAYYAFDVIRFFVPYAARLKLRGRVAR